MHSTFQFIACALIGTALALAAPRANAQRIIAHRGASHLFPENTKVAFRQAFAKGADGIEGDFYLTADGQIVCIHDADTQRTAGQRLVVEQSTLEQLRQLEYGAWKAPRFAGEPIPTLEDVLALIPAGKIFVIELKSGLPIVPVLVEKLRAAGFPPQQTWIISFHADVIRACKEQLPQVKCHWLTGFKQDKSTGAWAPTADEIARTVRATGADGVGMQAQPEVLDADFVDRLRNHGVAEFHVWTVDDPAVARHMQALGAIGITTNRPSFIRTALFGPSSP